MATLKDIRTRIKSIKSTQQVTKAMKMVSAAKLRRAQDSAIQARPYTAKLREMLGSLSTRVDTTMNPLLAGRDNVRKVLVVLITSDRGLCGAFSANIIKLAQRLITEELGELYRAGNVEMLCAGSKGENYFSKRDFSVVKSYPGVFQNLHFGIAKEIAEYVSERYLKGEVDQVKVVYNEFKSVLAPTMKSETLLPISPEKEADAKSGSTSDYIYEPSPAAIIDVLLPKHLNTQIWGMMLESNAAEHAARMTAMDSATENAKELLRTLNISYNRARQAAITTELSEIVAGAEALQGE